MAAAVLGGESFRIGSCISALTESDGAVVRNFPGWFEASSESEDAELESRLREQGYRHYGIFADDPGAMDVFDEIEHHRNQQTIGGCFSAR